LLQVAPSECSHILKEIVKLASSSLSTSCRIEMVLFQCRSMQQLMAHPGVDVEGVFQSVLQDWAVALPQVLWETGSKHVEVARAILDILQSALHQAVSSSTHDWGMRR
jgi:hypothetical protein